MSSTIFLQDLQGVAHNSTVLLSSGLRLMEAGRPRPTTQEAKEQSSPLTKWADREEYCVNKKRGCPTPFAFCAKGWELRTRIRASNNKCFRRVAAQPGTMTRPQRRAASQFEKKVPLRIRVYLHRLRKNYDRGRFWVGADFSPAAQPLKMCRRFSA